jgi:hypothetical protein
MEGHLLDFAKDEDIRVLDIRDANPAEKRVVAKVIRRYDASMFAMFVGKDRIQEKRYSVEFTLDVKLNKRLQVRVRSGERAGSNGQLKKTDTNSLISMGVQKEKGKGDGDGDGEQEEQQTQLEVQLTMKLGVGDTLKLFATDLEVLSPINNLHVVDGHLRRTCIVEDLSIDRLAAYTAANIQEDTYEFQLHDAISGLADDTSRKSRLTELVAFKNWKGVLLVSFKHTN